MRVHSLTVFLSKNWFYTKWVYCNLNFQTRGLEVPTFIWLFRNIGTKTPIILLELKFQEFILTDNKWYETCVTHVQVKEEGQYIGFTGLFNVSPLVT